MLCICFEFLRNKLQPSLVLRHTDIELGSILFCNSQVLANCKQLDLADCRQPTHHKIVYSMGITAHENEKYYQYFYKGFHIFKQTFQSSCGKGRKQESAKEWKRVNLWIR